MNNLPDMCENTLWQSRLQERIFDLKPGDKSVVISVSFGEKPIVFDLLILRHNPIRPFWNNGSLGQERRRHWGETVASRLLGDDAAVDGLRRQGWPAGLWGNGSDWRHHRLCWHRWLCKQKFQYMVSQKAIEFTLVTGIMRSG